MKSKITLSALLILALILGAIGGETSQAKTRNEYETTNVIKHEIQKDTENEIVKEEEKHVLEDSVEEKLEDKIETDSSEKETQVDDKTENKRMNKASLNKKQEIEDGEYYIGSSLDPNLVWKVAEPKKNSARVSLAKKDTTSSGQKIKITYGKDNYYTITIVDSGRVLDVSGASKENGAVVNQYSSNGTDAQKWSIEKTQDGYYSFISKCNGLYIDIPSGSAFEGNTLQMYEGNGTKAQKFIVKKQEIITGEKTIEEGEYIISLAQNSNRVIEVENASIQNFGNVRLGNKTNNSEQKVKIKYLGDGTYRMEFMHSGKVLDVYGGFGTNENNVDQYDSNGTGSQKWIVKQTEDGYYNIISQGTGLYLDIYGGYTTPGTNVQIYEGNGTMAQKFKFDKTTDIIEEGIYWIESGLNRNKGLDISEASLNNFGNVQIWNYTHESQQKFKLLSLGDNTYTIQALHSKKVLDVYGGYTANGTNVNQYDSNGTDAQKWIIQYAGEGYYSIISKGSGLYLDVSGAVDNNGTNVQIYEGNGTKAQKFKFNKVTDYEKGTYGRSGLKIKNGNQGTDLPYYRYGNGPNVLFATFSVHGFEDLWDRDGTELTTIANSFYQKLVAEKDNTLLENWTVYIFPEVNPDGRRSGWTKNGPGRTTLYSQAPNNKGIDLNRSWQTGSSYTRYTDSRNYNGTQGFQAYEAQALREFLLSKKSASGENILIDLHGWTTQLIGDRDICLNYYGPQFYGSKENSNSKYTPSYGTGYLISWARNSLGNGGKAARSALIELPSQGISSHQDVVNKDLGNKYIRATINMMKGLAK